jgi:hypothetical protein
MPNQAMELTASRGPGFTLEVFAVAAVSCGTSLVMLAAADLLSR